jgi:hypothetical protein
MFGCLRITSRLQCKALTNEANSQLDQQQESKDTELTTKLSESLATS